MDPAAGEGPPSTFLPVGLEDADARHKSGHDEFWKVRRYFACAVFRSAGEIKTLKRSHQMMTLGYFARSTPSGTA